MLYLLHRFVRFLCGFLPVLPLVAGYHAVLFKGRGRRRGTVPQLAAVYLLCLYLSAVFFVTDIPDLFHFRLEPSVNLVPLDDLFTNTAQYLLNILLFVPLGFLLPALWPSYGKLHRTALFGALFSLFIEVIQLFNYRATDIDDLLMNTAGAVLGWVAFRVAGTLFAGLPLLSAGGEAGDWRGRPLGYLLLVWLAVFFIQPVLGGWVLGLLFGGRVIIG